MVGTGRALYLLGALWACGGHGATPGDAGGDAPPDAVVAPTCTGYLGYPDLPLVLTGAQAIAQLHDLDGDGKLDLVAATTSDGTIRVARGLGGGRFAAPQSFVASGPGHYYDGLAVGDLDGDGKLDVVVVDARTDTVGVLLGNGDGSVRPYQAYATAMYPQHVAIADLDGDGHVDLVVATGSGATGATSVLHGNGDGTFQPHTEIAGRVDVLVLADLDGDGRPELVTGTGGSISVFVNSAAGLAPPVAYPTTHSTDYLEVRDVDGDGKLDIAVAGRSGPAATGQLDLLRGNGDGTLRAAIAVGTTVGMKPFLSGDVDGDGKLDIVTPGEILLAHGDGTFTSRVLPTTPEVPLPLALADLDGDGKADLVSGLPDAVAVQRGHGDGSFGASLAYDPTLPAGPHVLADFDGDGRLDLVDADHFQRGRGDGTFAAATPLGGPATISAITTADFDRDGHPDVAAQDQGLVAVSLGIGDGTFRTATPFMCGFTTLVSGDVDGDGIPDLVCAESVALGNGDGTFKAGRPTGLLGVSTPPVIADVDGDGRADLLVAIALSGPARTEVWLLPGHGDGTFAGAHRLSSTPGTLAIPIAAVDVDGDGRIDVVTVDEAAGLLTVFGNQGATFAPPVTYATGAGPAATSPGAQGLLALDTDGDGHPDLVASLSTGRIGVFRNQGDGTFAARLDFPGGGSLAAGDLNGDGRTDLAVAAAVLLNRCLSH